METIQLGGRRFRSIGNSTLDHDLYFIELLSRSGIDRDQRLEKESWDDWALRIMDRLLASGSTLPLLGCLLIPEAEEDEAWTRDMALETSTYIGSLTRPVDKERARELLPTVLIGFFVSGPRSSGSSRPSSPSRNEATDRPTAGRSGASWFDTLRRGISGMRKGFGRGRSAKPSSASASA